MATTDETQKEHEKKISALCKELAGKGADSDWALARALVHRAVHLVAEQKAAEYCALATFLGEMIIHAHPVLHPGEKIARAPGEFIH